MPFRKGELFDALPSMHHTEDPPRPVLSIDIQDLRTLPAWVKKPAEPTESGNQPIRARSLGQVTGNQPITDQHFLVRSVHGKHLSPTQPASKLYPVRKSHFLTLQLLTSLEPQTISPRVVEQQTRPPVSKNRLFCETYGDANINITLQGRVRSRDTEKCQVTVWKHFQKLRWENQ